MAATMLPSNFVTTDPKLAMNPNWTPNETSVPQANILVEDGNARLMVVAGRHPKVSSIDGVVGGLGYTSSFGDGVYNEESAVFRMGNINIQQCTALQLESVAIYFPGNDTGQASRNLTQTLCGDCVDDAFVSPKRVVLNQIDMSIPVLIKQTLHHFNVENYLPHGRNIAYYSILDLLTHVINAWTNFMHTTIGDASFFATLYVDNAGPRLYWTSATFGLHNIRLFLSQHEGQLPNFLHIVMNYIGFTNLRVGDTSQSSLGYAEGESLGFYARGETKFQNNTCVLTLHSNELTQFRKSDSIAPIEGTSLIGCITPPIFAGGGSNGGTYVYTAATGTLNSPKIAFDRSQTITEFLVSLRVFQGTSGHVVFLNSTELQQATCTLVFRLW